MLHVYIATFHCPNGILSQGGGRSIFKQTGRHKFQLSYDKRHAFSCIFCSHAHKEDIKLLDLRSSSILNISALLLFENTMHLLMNSLVLMGCQCLLDFFFKYTIFYSKKSCTFSKINASLSIYFIRIQYVAMVTCLSSANTSTNLY